MHVESTEMAADDSEPIRRVSIVVIVPYHVVRIVSACEHRDRIPQPGIENGTHIQRGLLYAVQKLKTVKTVG